MDNVLTVPSDRVPTLMSHPFRTVRWGGRASPEGRTVVYITAVHMSDGSRHEHIASVMWLNPETGKTGQNLKADMVEWIEENGVAQVGSPSGPVEVGVVNGTPKYLRTHANGQWSDNLLALPRF